MHTYCQQATKIFHIVLAVHKVEQATIDVVIP